MLRRWSLRMIALALAGATALAAAPALAGEQPDGEGGVLLGAGRADNQITGGGDKTGALLGLRVASRLCDKWNWFADGMYSQYEFTPSLDATKLFEFRTGPELLLGRPDRDAHWYLAGALGMADVNRPVGFADEGRVLGSLGIGLAQFSPSGGPRIELRAEQLLGTPAYTNWQLLLGFSFGLKAANEQPRLDSDGDGVYDDVDDCPGTPKGARVDARGCPMDSDGDGVYDGLDKCPGTPKGAIVDKDGCPLDSDGDGVYDGLDKCPGTPPGTKVDADGCPVKKALFEPGKKKLVLEGVHFAIDKAVLTPDSYAILDRVAESLKDWPDVRVEVGGHTDSTGTAAYNQDLSRRRAEAVRDYLIKKGIDGSRLEAKGYGETQPVADDGTSAGRAKNRRVELTKLD
jgi:OOP family OmpA-OmpF porin